MTGTPDNFGDYDYVIVGGGAAGCVLANRLTASGRFRVLLLDAGRPDVNPWIRIPLGYGRLARNPAYDWMFQCEKEPGLKWRSLLQSQGKVLGGSSSINGLAFVRGHRSDYDEWRDLGAPGWGFDDVLPYFRKSETHVLGGPYHGTDGPVTVSPQPAPHPLSTAFVEAARQTGAAHNDDFNGAELEGAGFYPMNTRRGRRCSAADAYLHPVHRRANLRVITGAHVTRIVFENGAAQAVEFLHNGALAVVRGQREIIVSAGAYNSPQLLQLSGVGDAEHLRSRGLVVVQDLPGVGGNLQNHYALTLAFQNRRGSSLNREIGNTLGQLRAGLRYVLFRSGPLAANATQGAVYYRSQPDLPRPDLDVTMSIFSARTDERARIAKTLHTFSGFSGQLHLLRPDSLGTVRLANPDPLAKPEIRLNFASTPRMRRAMAAGVKRLREIIAAPAMIPFAPEELAATRNIVTEDEIAELFAATGRTSNHPAGTCKMGQGAAAVVDEKLQVRGVRKLRVIDASIMPNVVSGNTMAPTLMIAEKGADLVLDHAAAHS